MKANEAPEKICISVIPSEFGGSKTITCDKDFPNAAEYTRTDAFIKKACEFLKDHLAGYDICEDDIERSVESFKLAMKL